MLVNVRQFVENPQVFIPSVIRPDISDRFLSVAAKLPNFFLRSGTYENIFASANRNRTSSKLVLPLSAASTQAGPKRTEGY
jgi:hypothetical protein